MPKGRDDEIAVQVQHALTAEFLGSLSLSASSKGDVLHQRFSQHLRHPNQKEIKLLTANFRKPQTQNLIYPCISFI